MFNIQEQLKKLPEKPGVYLMKNISGEIIYVGKANSLKNRVRQYFQSSKNHPPKVRAMVENIYEFEYIITDSEVEALILEGNLIKKYRPKYNVLLRDDKQYPYIKVTLGERFPRILKTRRIVKDGSKYFGPYIDVGAVNQTLEMLKKFYPLRTCTKKLDKIRDRPCLNHHIHQCLGPCIGKINHEEYMKMIDEVILFLSGKYKELVNSLEEKMKKSSMEMNFEKAAEYRDQIHAIHRMMEKQKIVLNSHIDQDLINMARDQENACVMVFFVRGGKLMGREHYILKVSSHDDRGEIINSFVKQFYGGTAFIPKEILIQDPMGDISLIETWLSKKRGSKVNIKIPQRGEKKELLEMVHKNAIEVLEKYSEKLIEDQQKSEGAVKELGEYLKLEKVPSRIEAFDISNTQGIHSVASMVVFEDGKPKYSDYRRFKIKTIEGPNDYGSIQEVIYRRLKKGIDEDGKFSKFPDLILLDGGLGQVNAAKDVLNALDIFIPMAGMVKDDHHKTEDLIYKGERVNIKKNRQVFQLIGRIQEEAHRFAISYHKSLRGSTMTQSVLQEIPGIGPKRIIHLLKYFGSIEKIKKASIEELCRVEGMNKRAAEEIRLYFQRKNQEQ